jgi:excisionase family DNA binding protein
MSQKHPIPFEQLLTIPEAAELCRVSDKTIRRWIKSAELPAARLGNQWRIRPKDLQRFFDNRLN